MGPYYGPIPMELDIAQRKNQAYSKEKQRTQKKYSKKDQKCFNCRKKGHFKAECRSTVKEYEKKKGNQTAKQTIQLASKEKMPIKKEKNEEVEVKKEEEEGPSQRKEEPPSGFFDDLIEHAKLIQELINALGIMLEEVQANLHLLPKES